MDVLPPLQVEPVARLLGYLRTLQCQLDECPEAREDWVATEILLDVLLPEDSAYIKNLVVFYVDERYRKSRTLGVWYAIAKAVARLIQEHTQ